MKILILANDSGGLYNFRRELIEELLKNNEIVISVPNGNFIDVLSDMGVRHINTPVDRRGIKPIKDVMLIYRYRKIVKSEIPDSVITYTIKPNIYGGIVCGISKIPYAINITGLGTAFQKAGILRTIVVRLYKIALNKAKVVFFENSENRKLFIDEAIVNENKTCLLMGAGVNLNRFQVTDYPRGDTVKFLFMGRVMKEKGIDELLLAMKRLIDEKRQVELSVLGSLEENYSEEIERYEAEGWLHYYGVQKDVRPYIAKSHCFVLPSWHEGMANTNLECAAMGRPVITSNIHGCLEAVEDGVSGYLCEKQNVDSLYQVMKEFIGLSHEERKAMGLAGRKHMEKVFDKKKVVQDTIQKLDV